jgi:hypothetical protein
MAITAIGPVSLALNDSPPPSNATYTATARPVSADIDTQDGGPYKVTGTTKLVGPPLAPVSTKVWLCDRLSGRVVREVWSNATTGAYAFERVRVGPYYVVGFDHAGVFNAVIADRIEPELM